jgi:hypothetical protein
MRGERAELKEAFMPPIVYTAEDLQRALRNVIENRHIYATYKAFARASRKFNEGLMLFGHALDPVQTEMDSQHFDMVERIVKAK